MVKPCFKLGNYIVLWSGNHIGHHSTIRDNVFIASHVVISGFCDIGENSFIGVNATFANNVRLGKDCLVGAGATILKDAAPKGLYGAKQTELKTRSPLEYFGVAEEE